MKKFLAVVGVLAVVGASYYVGAARREPAAEREGSSDEVIVVDEIPEEQEPPFDPIARLLEVLPLGGGEGAWVELRYVPRAGASQVCEAAAVISGGTEIGEIGIATFYYKRLESEEYARLLATAGLGDAVRAHVRGVRYDPAADPDGSRFAGSVESCPNFEALGGHWVLDGDEKIAGDFLVGPTDRVALSGPAREIALADVCYPHPYRDGTCGKDCVIENPDEWLCGELMGTAEYSANPGAASGPGGGVKEIERFVAAERDGAVVPFAGFAISHITEWSGGTGSFHQLAYLEPGIEGELYLTSSAHIGDRADLVHAWLAREGVIGTLEVRQGPNDPACCPTELYAAEYSISGGKIEFLRGGPVQSVDQASPLIDGLSPRELFGW
jgi:hypothetical protein